MKQGLRVIDSDLHVIEGGDVYDRYLEDEFRDRAPRYMGLGPTNFPWWKVAGKHIPPWALSDDVAAAQRYLDAPTEAVYRPIRDRGYTAEAALAAMDAEGIDRAVVFRTFAHMLVSIDGLDGPFATALCRAFNRWLTAYCSVDGERLKPAAIVSLHDPELAAGEARRAVEDGHVGVVILPMPVDGRYLHAPECDVLWAEVQRLGVPLLVHGTSGGANQDYVSNRFVGHPNYRTLNHSAAFSLELMMAMGALTTGGVLERYPMLRVGFLEGNCGWLPWWLNRLDDQWHKYGGGEKTALHAQPSEFFKRQCFIGTDVDEDLLGTVIDDIGDDNIVVSTDYPHADGPFPHGIDTFLEASRVSLESKRKILWDNCQRLYGFAGQ
jgi:predicted TIM-barrel fold metal-dependent hydrolase